MKNTIKQDIVEIGGLSIVPKILSLVCQTTGMRFAAVARLTEDKWIALAVQDDLGYGLKPGDEMDVLDTLCSDVRRFEKPIVIDNVEEDVDYKNHRIPKAFGFRSHISVPILRNDGIMYGTLCAVDPDASELNNARILGLFFFLADLIAEHLDTLDILKSNTKDFNAQVKISDSLEGVVHLRTADLKRKIRELARSNQELKNFSHIASHDLQEPLRKIQTYLSMLGLQERAALSSKGKSYLDKIETSVERMRRLINDLLAYSVVQTVPAQFETTDLSAVVQTVKEILSEVIASKKARVSAKGLCTIQAYPYQIQQLFQNLIGNALKYSDPGRPPHIEIFAQTVSGSQLLPHLESQRSYCKVTVKDNGIGFEQQYAKQIFDIFERLHGKGDYSGTGIGLSIVRKIVENHNGFISVESEVGKGSTFTMYFPQD